MSGLLERLRRGEDVVLGDGAVGTLLRGKGLGAGEPPESFNLTRPDVVEWAAAAYVDAGSEIVQTNTLGGNEIRLALFGLADRADEIHRAAVAAARRGARGRALVAGTCGPTGLRLKPDGGALRNLIRDAFERQMAALLDSGVDMFIIETMTDLEEALVALEAAREAAGDGFPVAVTMAFAPAESGFATACGDRVEACASALAAAGADIVGSNCGREPADMIGIAADFREHTDLPLLIQPSAGLPRMDGEEAVYPVGPDLLARTAKELLKVGVSVLGGCCGTTPEHIRALRRVIDS